MGLGEAGQAGRGRGVISLAGKADHAAHRRDENYRARHLASEHVPEHHLGDVVSAGEVNVYHFLPLLGLHLEHELVPGYSGVADKDMGRAVGFDERIQDLLHLLPVGHVKAGLDGAASAVLYLLDQGQRRVPVGLVVHPDREPVGCQPGCDCPSYAPAGTCHEGVASPAVTRVAHGRKRYHCRTRGVNQSRAPACILNKYTV